VPSQLVREKWAIGSICRTALEDVSNVKIEIKFRKALKDIIADPNRIFLLASIFGALQVHMMHMHALQLNIVHSIPGCLGRKEQAGNNA